MKISEVVSSQPSANAVYMAAGELAFGLANTTPARVKQLLKLVAKKAPDMDITEWTLIPESEFQLYEIGEFAQLFQDERQLVQWLSEYYEFGEALPGIYQAIDGLSPAQKTKVANQAKNIPSRRNKH